jgi:GntR family transcriptional regulator
MRREKGTHSLKKGSETVTIDCTMDRESFVPLYLQIKSWLLAKVEAGQLSRGDLIPSETQFSTVLKVSRGTVRQALYELRLEGYLVGKKGLGTFIGFPDSGNARLRRRRSSKKPRHDR